MNLPNIVARASMTIAVIALAASGFQVPIAIAAPVRSGFVELSDATIFYRHAGQGPPVIFIHALLLDSRLWLDQLNELCARRYCLAPDLSGFGFSSPMHGGRVDFSRYADEVIEFLDAMKIREPVDVVAVSAGGNIAALAYLKQPRRFRSLALISTGFGVGTLDPAMAKYRAENARNLIIEGKDMLFRRFNEYIVDAGASLMARARYKTMFEQTSYESHVAFLTTTDFPSPATLPAAIKIPVLLPIGRGDSVLSVDAADKLAAALPSGRVVRIDAAGRLLPLEAPNELNVALSQFWVELDHKGGAK